MNNTEAINIIKRTCKSIFPDSRILLFGSRSRADYSVNSDFDFMIITKNTLGIKEKRNYKAQLRKSLAAYKIPADILIQSEEEISLKKEVTGHIVREVMKEGIAI
jgi:predicted nucleotidyltransferase